LSQEKLGDALGLTFQQIQKYERGTNRIGSSRLFKLSQVLDVPISFFFDDMGEAEAAGGFAEGAQAPYESDQLARRESLELVRAYYRIEDPAVRKRVFDLVKSLAPAKRD
jgi:transcriptional regulator with XRE-family HTH domain